MLSSNSTVFLTTSFSSYLRPLKQPFLLSQHTNWPLTHIICVIQMIMQGAVLAGVVIAIQAIYKVSCILKCGQSLMHLSCCKNHMAGHTCMLQVWRCLAINSKSWIWLVAPSFWALEWLTVLLVAWPLYPPSLLEGSGVRDYPSAWPNPACQYTFQS